MPGILFWRASLFLGWWLRGFQEEEEQSSSPFSWPPAVNQQLCIRGATVNDGVPLPDSKHRLVRASLSLRSLHTWLFTLISLLCCLPLHPPVSLCVFVRKPTATGHCLLHWICWLCRYQIRRNHVLFPVLNIIKMLLHLWKLDYLDLTIMKVADQLKSDHQ